MGRRPYPSAVGGRRYLDPGTVSGSRMSAYQLGIALPGFVIAFLIFGLFVVVKEFTHG
jgi:hypothetical protein